jgi:adenylate kinase family enzyme
MHTNIKRVSVLGSPGSGKSTFAARLGVLLDLPVTHLDDLFWATWSAGPDPTSAQIRTKLDEIIQQPAWIIDGNHGGQASINARQSRLNAADTIILLDLPALLCVVQLLQRRLALLNRPRHTLRPYERLTWAMIHAAWTFRARGLKAEVLMYAQAKRVIILATPGDVANLIASWTPR